MDITTYQKYEPIFGSWHISRLIGEGSYGAVFEIVREDFGTTYRSALKVIPIPHSSDELETIRSSMPDEASAATYLRQYTQRIVDEYALMARLKGNSHVVSCEDHAVIPHEDGLGYDILIRMELLTPLKEHFANIAVTEQEIVRLGIDMCRALELCERNSIIHRDIKPDNIFISDNGNYKLGDFGIARRMESSRAGMTKTGTPVYMAPEVYAGRPYDTSVDLYSLGIVLYRYLNYNRSPFLPPYPSPVTPDDSENAFARRMHGEALPRPLWASSDRLCAAVIKAASFDPANRFASPTQMREELEAVLAELNGAAAAQRPSNAGAKVVPAVVHAPSGSAPRAQNPASVPSARQNVPPAAPEVQPSPAIYGSVGPNPVPAPASVPHKRPTQPKANNTKPGDRAMRGVVAALIAVSACLLGVIALLIIKPNFGKKGAKYSSGDISLYSPGTVIELAPNYLDEPDTSETDPDTDDEEYETADDPEEVTEEEAETEEEAAEEEPAEEEEIAPREALRNELENASVFDTVLFGRYEQDGYASNGAEDISWIVLNKQGSSLLLISRYALDCKVYHYSKTDVTWETSSLRNWLNGTFLYSAFNSDELDMMVMQSVRQSYNPQYGTDPGRDTSDAVTILSINEAKQYFGSDAARRCEPTTFAVRNGVDLYSDTNYCWWWLRTPAQTSYAAAYVGRNGTVYSFGPFVNYGSVGVRPVIRVDIG